MNTRRNSKQIMLNQLKNTYAQCKSLLYFPSMFFIRNEKDNELTQFVQILL